MKLSAEKLRQIAKPLGYRVTRRTIIDGQPYRYGIIDDAGELVAAYNSPASVWIHLRKLQAVTV